MQTFLPYKDFVKSARCLDNKRLGKQRVEAYQILNALTCPVSRGWINHPATRMWMGHEGALWVYASCVCDEWVRRGYSNDKMKKNLSRIGKKLSKRSSWNLVPPSWLGRREFHASHRSNLLRKDAEWYGRFGWKEPSDLEYVWPV
jgi:hypothetical protein